MSMTLILAVIFWAGVAGVLYAYVIFPLVMLLAARRGRRGSPRQGGTMAATIIVPAYNEEASLQAKILNVLAADYPAEQLEVLVVSDASTDRTNEIARSFESQGVRLIVQETRRGKTAGLNRAISIARGEVVIFTDANAAYEPETIRILVGYFHDARVGLVSGYTKYSVSATGEVAEATNAYTSLERAIKRGESVWGCCVGADGAIFAMRRSLWRPLRDDDINDLVLPLSVIGQGYHCLLAEDAFCTEHPGKNLESEFRRQSRITNRSLRAIWRHAHLLNPVRFPAFSFFLFSHKVVRFLVPWLMPASLIALVPLATGSVVYAGIAILSAMAAVIVLVTTKSGEGSWLRRRPLVRLLNVFVMMNLAMLHGWSKFLSGHSETTWQHDRVLSR
jgi:cellulose synthase/poly-beta-1,6-N-acetylglucosamine synthase-like glycosyltransferase